MVQPAWKNMQQNLLRWFFRAYVNRLGTHLIELYSGRLAIGADQYRRLTRQGPGRPATADEGSGPAGHRGGRGARLRQGRPDRRARPAPGLADPSGRSRLEAAGFDEAWPTDCTTAEWVEV